MVHAEVVLGFLEALFDRPTQSRRPVQFFLGCIGRSVAEGELELSISEAADVEPDVTARQIVPAFDDPERLDIGDYGALCSLRQDHPLPGDTVIRGYLRDWNRREGSLELSGSLAPPAVLRKCYLGSISPYQGGGMDVGEVPAFLGQAVQECLGLAEKTVAADPLGLEQAGVESLFFASRLPSPAWS